MLRVENISYSVGSRRILEDISFEVHANEVVSLIGPNGAGKSTLLSVIAGDAKQDSGVVQLDDALTSSYSPRDMARRRAVLLQKTQVAFSYTVCEVVAMGRTPWRGTIRIDEDEAVIEQMMIRTEVAQFAERDITTLSGGESGRAHLARVFAQQTPLLLLDEPTNGLDPDISLTIRQLIRSLADDGTAILLTSHLLGEIEELAHRVTVIGAGRVAVSGTVADVAAHAGISATTVGRVGANAGPVLQELTRSLGDAGTLLLTPHGSEWEITVYWNERSVSEGPRPFSTEHAEALLTRILAEREVQMLTPLYTRPATLEEAYLAMAEGLKR